MTRGALPAAVVAVLLLATAGSRVAAPGFPAAADAQTPAALVTTAARSTPAPAGAPLLPVVQADGATPTAADVGTTAVTDRGVALDQQSGTGAPAFLAITIAPATLSATAQPIEAVFIQLLDASGRPVLATVPVVVRLASTDPRTANVPGAVTIEPGSGAASSTVTALAQGSTTLTAQADGLTSAQARLNVEGDVVPVQGRALGIEFAPRRLIVGAPGPSWLTVMVLDSPNGVPVPVATDTEIRLVSSRPDVLEVPATAVIAVGAFSTTVDVRAIAEGTAFVTALRSGLAAAILDVPIMLAPDRPPAALDVVAVPSRTLAGSLTQPRFVVQAFSGESAVEFPCGELQLASAVPGVMAVPDHVTPECGPGWQAVVIEGSAGNEGGETTITVASAGLTAAQIPVRASGSTLAKLQVTLAPAAPMYGSASVGWLIIQATDVGGRPSRVAADLEVTVSGPPGLAPQTVTIPRATSSTVVALGALPPDAQPTLRVSAPGVEAAELTVRPSRGSLPAVSGPAGGGTPAPAFEFGRWRIPVLWVFIPAAVAVLGLLAVVAWSMRSARPESP